MLEAFTPDFYLPELDRYVELTMMKHRLIYRKNRKIRLLRELYPEISISIFYERDLEDIQLRFSS